MPKRPSFVIAAAALTLACTSNPEVTMRTMEAPLVAMEPMQMWITLLSSLLSGLLGVLISTLYYRRYETRKLKFDTLRKLAGARYALTPSGDADGRRDFFYALNEAYVVFHDCPSVLAQLEKMKSELGQANRLEDNIVKLFKAIWESLDMKPLYLNDSFITTPFAPPTR